MCRNLLPEQYNHGQHLPDVWSDNRIVATIGLDNVIVVDTDDALLVCAKDKAQDVRKIVQILKAKNLRKYI